MGRLKGISLPENIGESIEISGLPGEESVVKNGCLAGRKLSEVLEECGADVLGRQNFERHGTRFPLLVKFISAAADLSIQVHPDDAMARTLGHPYGKSEMWYVVRADENAKILSGFSVDFSEGRYLQDLAYGTLCEHLNILPVKAGDCFHVPAGRIHSIGAGCLLVEIQQSNDDTFRVYDFDRKDIDGRPRELHVEQARKALSYEAVKEPRTNYTPELNKPVLLISEPHFTSRLCRFTVPQTLDYASLDSFVCFVVFEGKARLTDAAGITMEIAAGQTVLFPAVNSSVTVEPMETGVGFIETYI